MLAIATQVLEEGAGVVAYQELAATAELVVVLVLEVVEALIMEELAGVVEV